MLLWAWLALTPRADAQQVTVADDLASVRDAVEHAQFELAVAEARDLLARDSLRARERNTALELLAIAQIATRHEADAQATLSELFARDPDHALRFRDPGPQVEAAFARAHAHPRAPMEVEVSTRAERDSHGRTFIEVGLGEGRDAVESVNVFAQAEGESTATQLVAEADLREHVSLTLPALDPRSLTRPRPALTLYVEARAPSGYVLGRDGTRDAPLRVLLDPQPQSAPLRRSWWVWTSVAIVVAGVAIGGAIAAH